MKKSHDSIGLSTYDLDNLIMEPDEIADIILLPEENELKSELILPWAVKYLEPDEMPFFAVISLSDFLVMKPLSDDPNAIYGYGEKIEKDFETFIHNLYYKSPTFYLNQSEFTKPEVKPTEEELLHGTPARGPLWKYVNHNYHKTFRELGIYEKYRYGGEPAALEMVKEFNIFVNKCPDCGNIKATPRARQYLECMKFHDPIYS